MRFYLILSLVFHLVVAILCFAGLPSLLEREIKTDYVMVAEVVTTSDLTNVLIKAAQAPEKHAETPKAPKSIKEEVVEEKKAEEHKAEIIEKDQQVVAENIAPKKKEEKPKPEKKKAEQKAKKTETKKTPKKKDDSFEKSILKSLEENNKKSKEKPETKDKKIEKDFSDLANALVGETNKEYNSNLPITMSEVDAIRNQISHNWNTTSFSGSADAKSMKVTIKIELDIEGDVLYVKPETQNNNSSHYKVFVESAIRAVKLSSPLQNLSKEKFASWKEIEFDFDSSGMIY